MRARRTSGNQWPALCAALVLPALALAGAHIGHTAAKRMIKAMDESKITLSDAIKTAEESCKGKAVLAHCEMEKHNLVIAVFCVTADNKLMDVDIDAKTRKVSESKEVKEEKKGEKKAEEADEDVTPAQAAKIVKAFDEAKATLAAFTKAAEENSAGKAILAEATLDKDKLTAEIYCVAGDKYLEVAVDGKTGKVTASKDIGKKAEKGAPGAKKEEPKKGEPK